MKKITARIGEYKNQQGETKGRFVEIGAIGVSQQGKEYVLINPTVDLGGVLALQNVQAWKEGKEPSERIIASVFDESASQGQQGGYTPPQGGYQAPQQNYQQPQQQAPQNYQQPQRQPHQQSNSAPNRSAPAQGMDSFDDD